MDSDLEVVLTTGPSWFEERLEDRLTIGTDQRRCTASNGDQLLGLHAQDDTIVKVTSPSDSTVTDGHLCIKGRFGFEFVNNRPGRE